MIAPVTANIPFVTHTKAVDSGQMQVTKIDSSPDAVTPVSEHSLPDL